MKVRFELNIDEIIEHPIQINSDDPIFKNPEASGKTFLFVDKLTNMMQAIYCKSASTENKKYAQLDFFPIPHNAIIIDEEHKENSEYETLMSHIQNCCDKVCEVVKHTSQNNWDKTDNDSAVIRAMIEESSTGNGVSEKTLLNALEIVTKK